MGLFDDLKKWAHPYGDEDDDYDMEFEEMNRKESLIEERRNNDDRRGKVVNIHEHDRRSGGGIPKPGTPGRRPGGRNPDPHQWPPYRGCAGL